MAENYQHIFIILSLIAAILIIYYMYYGDNSDNNGNNDNNVYEGFLNQLPSNIIDSTTTTPSNNVYNTLTPTTSQFNYNNSSGMTPSQFKNLIENTQNASSNPPTSSNTFVPQNLNDSAYYSDITTVTPSPTTTTTSVPTNFDTEHFTSVSSPSQDVVNTNEPNVKKYNASDFLPKEINNEWFDTDFSQAKYNITASINPDKYVIGINTVGQSLKNASYDIRGTVPNPKFVVSPWNNSTYEADTNIKQMC